MDANASLSLSTSLATAIKTALSAGAGDKLLRVYSGTIPATGGGVITTQVKLLEFEIDPATWDVIDGELHVPASGSAVGLANGVARWARFVDGNNAAVLDVDVSSAGGHGFVRLTTIGVIVGQPSSILAGTIKI